VYPRPRSVSAAEPPDYDAVTMAQESLVERARRWVLENYPFNSGHLVRTLEWVDRWIEIEINSSDDNPLFDVGAGRVQSGGNFYGSHITQAMDSLKVALANMCDLIDRQLELIVDEKFNAGLTPNLIPYFDPTDPEAGLHHGFKGMQLSCSALTAEAVVALAAGDMPAAEWAPFDARRFRST